jgi:hypothetical protein
MFGDNDLAAIFADFGVSIIWTPAAGGEPVTAVGILDVYQDMFAHGNGPGAFEQTEFLLRVPKAALGSTLQPKDQIAIASQPNLPPGFAPGTYTVRNLPKCQDASIVEMTLKLAGS